MNKLAIKKCLQHELRDNIAGKTIKFVQIYVQPSHATTKILRTDQKINLKFSSTNTKLSLASKSSIIYKQNSISNLKPIKKQIPLVVQAHKDKKELNIIPRPYSQQKKGQRIPGTIKKRSLSVAQFKGFKGYIQTKQIVPKQQSILIDPSKNPLKLYSFGKNDRDRINKPNLFEEVKPEIIKQITKIERQYGIRKIQNSQIQMNDIIQKKFQGKSENQSILNSLKNCQIYSDNMTKQILALRQNIRNNLKRFGQQKKVDINPEQHLAQSFYISSDKLNKIHGESIYSTPEFYNESRETNSFFTPKKTKIMEISSPSTAS